MNPKYYQDSPYDSKLKQEIKLQINQQLYEQRLIAREVYEQAKAKLISPT